MQGADALQHPIFALYRREVAMALHERGNRKSRSLAA